MLAVTWGKLRSVNFKFDAAAAKSLQSCPTLCDPIDGSPPGSPVPGILQARTLEWAATAFSGISSLFIHKKRTEIPTLQGTFKNLKL